MKAMVLCGGRGIRLGQLTKKVPKPLLYVNEKPILHYIVDHLKTLNIDEILVNGHYQKHLIHAFCELNTVHYIDENALLGTAGSIRNAKNWLDTENFLVHYGDVICFENYNKMLKFHKENNALATILTHKAISNSILESTSKNQVTRFWERHGEKKLPRVTNSGVYIFNKDIFNHIPEGVSDFPKDIFMPLINNRHWRKAKIFHYPLSAYRIAIDSPERLEQANAEVH